MCPGTPASERGICESGVLTWAYSPSDASMLRWAGSSFSFRVLRVACVVQMIMVPWLIDNPSIGYVQARWAFTNPEESYLTKACPS